MGLLLMVREAIPFSIWEKKDKASGFLVSIMRPIKYISRNSPKSPKLYDYVYIYIHI